jgi:branched-chain amino acid transport system ATP-binding protein
VTLLLDVQIAASGYGGVHVLRDVDVSVGEGEVVAVLGGNGAGKTTLLRTISGVLVRAQAKVSLAGHDISRVSPPARVAAGVVHVPEGRRVFGDLTVLENLLVPVYARHRRRGGNEADLEHAFTLFPILRERRNQRAASLSGGQQQMLAIARGLLARPRLLMVDEASLGLAPTAVEEVFDALRVLRDEGLAILLVEQNVRSSLELADRAYVLEHGTVAFDGPGRELLDDERVAASYLGGPVAGDVGG